MGVFINSNHCLLEIAYMYTIGLIQVHVVVVPIYIYSAGFRTNGALYQLSYEAPYLDPGGGRLGRLTQAVMHTCSGNLGIVKI